MRMHYIDFDKAPAKYGSSMLPVLGCNGHTLTTFSKEKSGLLMYFFTLVMSALETLSLLKVLICVCACVRLGFYAKKDCRWQGYDELMLELCVVYLT